MVRLRIKAVRPHTRIHRQYRKSPDYDEKRKKNGMSIAHLNSLWDHSVQAGKVLNPHGKRGFHPESKHEKQFDGPIWRKGAMQRKRLKLEIRQAIALEAHELQQLARENAKVAMDTLIEITKNKRAPEATRIAASQALLDRGYGKSSQISMTANISHGKTSDITTDELDNRVKQTLQRVEELTNRTRKERARPQGSVDLRKLN